jgi:hypothetical protein
MESPMKLPKRALIAITAFFYLVAFVWYIAIWINGGQFRRYLFANAIFLCLSSFIMYVIISSRWRLQKGDSIHFRKFLVIWLTLGFGAAILLFVFERFLSFSFSEPFLFTVWPSNAILMVPGPPNALSLLFFLLSFTTNAVLYSAWSSLIWWLSRLFPKFSDSQPAVFR